MSKIALIKDSTSDVDKDIKYLVKQKLVRSWHDED